MLIVLSGYYGFDNAGDEALLPAICSSIQRLEPKAEFVVLSGYPEKTEQLHQLPAIDRMKPWQVFKVLRKADLLISGGGSLFQDVTGPRSLPYYISVVALAKMLGKPVIFYAQGVGPIKRPFSRFLMRWWGNKVEMITLRDEQSKHLLAELGVTRPPIYVTADPVFTLDPSPEQHEYAQELLRHYQLEPGRLIGVSVRPWLALADLRPDIARLLDCLVLDGYQVLFIPMDYGFDLPESHLIAAMMNQPATILDENLSSLEIIALMSNVEMMIGMRLHSLIFAASRGVPFAGISYDPKIDAFLESFDLQPLNDTYPAMYEKVKTLLNDENRQSYIRQHAEELHDRAEQNAVMALSLIKQDDELPAPQRKRILHIIGGGEIGGAEELVYTMMKLTNPEQYDVHLICLCEGPFADLVGAEGFPARTIPMRHKADIKKIKSVRAYIREQQIDLVHTHGVRANLIGRPAAKREGIPVVTTFHSMLRYDYDRNWKASLARLLTMQGNHYTDTFIAISHAIGEDLRNMHIDPERIQVIHSGLDVSKFQSRRDTDQLKERLGLSPERLTFTMVARLHPVKGHRYFLSAARRLVDAGVPAQFLLIGEGISRPEIEAQVKELGLESLVFMPGYYSKVEDIYRISDVLCVPSLMEGLGLVILEGMYFGVPIIASRVGGIPELIEDGKSGLLIPPADVEALYEAMYKTACSPELMQQLAQEGRRRVQHFTVESMAQQVEKCYEQLLES